MLYVWRKKRKLQLNWKNYAIKRYPGILIVTRQLGRTQENIFFFFLLDGGEGWGNIKCKMFTNIIIFYSLGTRVYIDLFYSQISRETLKLPLHYPAWNPIFVTVGVFSVVQNVFFFFFHNYYYQQYIVTSRLEFELFGYNVYVIRSYFYVQRVYLTQYY